MDEGWCGIKLSCTIVIAKETGVKGIEINGLQNSTEAVYDLQGTRVQNTAKPGLYIVRKGGKTFKMLRHLKWKVKNPFAYKWKIHLLLLRKIELFAFIQ